MEYFTTPRRDIVEEEDPQETPQVMERSGTEEEPQDPGTAASIAAVASAATFGDMRLHEQEAQDLEDTLLQEAKDALTSIMIKARLIFGTDDCETCDWSRIGVSPPMNYEDYERYGERFKDDVMLKTLFEIVLEDGTYPPSSGPVTLAHEFTRTEVKSIYDLFVYDTAGDFIFHTLTRKVRKSRFVS